MENTEKIRMHIIFRGEVQGVGFRYKAKYAASNLGLTGWVRNEWDGSVEMEVQGTRQAINRMLVVLNADSWIRVENMEKEIIPVDPKEKRFRTDYSY